MENEKMNLRRDLERYRFLLSTNSDAQADKVIRELVAEAEARLAKLEAGDERGRSNQPLEVRMGLARLSSER